MKFRLIGCVFASVTHAALFSGALHADELNLKTLCPQSGSHGQTILLVDTTDPLTPVAQERLKQLLAGFRNSDNEHYLPQNHELIAYHLVPRIDDLAQPLRVCNPGNPKDRSWSDSLTSGSYRPRLAWRRFAGAVLRAIPSPDAQVTGEHSPLLETVALITARHVANIGVGDGRKPTNLIIFSDMLQHSARLSHYKTFPDARELKNMRGYVDVRSDLAGVNVWIFYVQRAAHEHLQTVQHYNWWTRVIQSFGGRIKRQKPL